ncbi:hypothetical protein GF325_01175 [Candidatus Bathyarchaeota archaeon]|nr:hypothetical protein [Candidatus Bathyarchaeota archaeon]
MVNDFIHLKLEGSTTVIYVDGERFDQCKRILIQIPVENKDAFDEVESIDEIARISSTAHDDDATRYHIDNVELSPESEFWGHCSNLQAWAENSYDTRLLHSNLAFPLLKRLAELGDPVARRVFRFEIVSRLMSGYSGTILFLFLKGYIEFLHDEDIDDLLIHFHDIGIDIEFILELIKHGYLHKLRDEHLQFNVERIYQLFCSKENIEECINLHGTPSVWIDHLGELVRRTCKVPAGSLILAIYPRLLNKHSITDFARLVELSKVMPSHADIQEAYTILANYGCFTMQEDYMRMLAEVTGVEPSEDTLKILYQVDTWWNPAHGYIANRTYHYLDLKFVEMRYACLKALLLQQSLGDDDLEEILASLVDALFLGWELRQKQSKTYLEMVLEQGERPFLEQWMDGLMHAMVTRFGFGWRRVAFFQKKTRLMGNKQFVDWIITKGIPIIEVTVQPGESRHDMQCPGCNSILAFLPPCVCDSCGMLVQVTYQ